MAETKYIVTEIVPTNVGVEDISSVDRSIVSSYKINSSFDQTQHKVELSIYSLDGNLLDTFINPTTIGQSTDNSLQLDPQADAINAGYDQGDIQLVYNFLRTLTPGSFRITEISADRTELKLTQGSLQTSIADVVETLRDTLSNTGQFRVSTGANDHLIAINVQQIDTNLAIKLYEPLPSYVAIKQLVTFTEFVLDSLAYSIQAEYIPDPIVYPALKGPNFTVDTGEQNIQNTEYLDYNSLYSYPVTSSYHKVITLLSASGAEVNIDYTDYNNFVHFSSAEERLANFKHKVLLLENYTVSASIDSSYKLYYDNLTKGIISKFDGYEQFLYFKSGSSSWPKINSSPPYLNATVSSATDWYEEQIISASTYDNLNDSRLAYTTPEFLREDPSNAPFNLFLHMIGQHFDNLWLYTKAVTDKYNADNRLDYGISRDLVGDALKSLGVKLYSSNFSVSNLSANFLGEFFNTGSEQINSFVTASNEPTPDRDILTETYKRIYHNLPYLIKTKGTERGLRALINCFGVPSGSLEIKTYGGSERLQAAPYFGSTLPSTSKIRLDNTGSLTTGDTVSQYTSIQRPADKYTQDQHVVEIGFSPAYNIDNYISSSITGSFNIDEYLGDIGYAQSSSYSGLYSHAETLLSGSTAYDMYDFVRLIKFYDNQLFKMIKDFVPARDNITTGIIIKPHLLNRAKIQQPIITTSRPEHDATINTAFVTGSSGGVLENYSTAYTGSILTPSGSITRYYSDNTARINGELGGTVLDMYSGSLNEANNLKKPSTVLPIYTSSGSGQVTPPPGEFYWQKGDVRGSGGSITGTQVKYIYINEIDLDGTDIENALSNLKSGDKITFTVKFENQGEPLGPI